jgi:hypothetical protein
MTKKKVEVAEKVEVVVPNGTEDLNTLDPTRSDI